MPGTRPSASSTSWARVFRTSSPTAFRRRRPRRSGGGPTATGGCSARSSTTPPRSGWPICPPTRGPPGSRRAIPGCGPSSGCPSGSREGDLRQPLPHREARWRGVQRLRPPHGPGARHGAGIAIGNARLYEAARQQGALDRRFGRGHDGAPVGRGRRRGPVGGRRTGPPARGRRRRHRAAARRGGRSGDRRRVVRRPLVVARGDHPGPERGGEETPRGEAVFIDDSASDGRMVTRLAERFGPSMLLPLQSGGRVLGALATPRSGARARSRRPSGRSPRSSPPRRRWR